MNFLLRLAVPVSLLVVAGCATTPLDYRELETQVNEAGAGEFAECMQSLHAGAVGLEKAEADLVRAKADLMGEDEYKTAVAGASQAVADRTAAEDFCNRRTAALEGDVAMLKEQVANNDARLKKLEQVREVVRGVTFKTGSAQLTTQAKTVLQVVANRLIRSPVKVQIAGHTSSTGSAESNMTLSQRRAESVRAYLVSLGVDSKNLSAKGYGQSQPVASNDTQDGRDANKRVELRFNE